MRKASTKRSRSEVRSLYAFQSDTTGLAFGLSVEGAVGTDDDAVALDEVATGLGAAFGVDFGGMTG